MLSRWKTVSFLLFSSLLFASVLSACQSGPVSRVQACNAKALPLVKIRQPVPTLNQTVYATSGSHLYALLASNGTLRWCSALALDNGQPDQFASISHAGDQLYTFTEAGIITDLTTHSGAEVWSTNTGNQYDDAVSMASSPSIANGTIFGGTTLNLG